LGKIDPRCPLDLSRVPVVSAAERSLGWQIVAAISIVIHVATIVVVLFVGSLGVLFKLGVFVFMGSNIPRILDPWLQYSPVTRKRTGIVRLAGIWVGLILMVVGALLH
jgi:hypothetical protein